MSGVLTTNSINLHGFNKIRIHYDLPIFSTNSKDNRKDILCCIYPNADYYLNMINYANESFYKLKLNTNKVGQQKFALRNQFDELIDLNGQDWSATLILDTKND